MISDFLLGLRDKELFFEKALLAMDQAQVLMTDALKKTIAKGRAAFHWIRILTLAALACLAISIACTLALVVSLILGGPYWINVIVAIFAAIFALGGLVLLMPIVLVAQAAIAAFPSLKQSLTKYPGFIASAAFLILFTLFTYWKLHSVFSSEAAGSLLLVMIVIAVGSAVGWVALPISKLKLIVTSQLTLCFLFVLAMAILPRLLPAMGRWMRHQETTLASRIDNETSMLVALDPDNPSPMFTTDGKPLYCFTKNKQGNFRIFSITVSVDPFLGIPTTPITKIETVEEIISQLRSVRTREQLLAIEKTRSEQAKTEREALEQTSRLKEERDRIAAESTRQKAEADQNMAQAKKQRIAGYVSDKTFLNSAEKLEIAVLTRASDGTASDDVAAVIGDVLRSKGGMNVTHSLFSKSFFEDGYFRKATEGQSSELVDLELGKHADILMFVTKSVQPNKTEFADLLSAKVTLNFKVITASDGRLLESFSINAAGVGVNANKCEEMALERLMDQLKKREIKRL